MRIYLNDEEEELIKKDERILKSNYESRKNYSIESEILEKRLVINEILISYKPAIYYLVDWKLCYHHQLVNIEGLIEELIGKNCNIIQIIIKLIPRWKYYISIAHRISEKYYGGTECELAVTGQGNKCFLEMCVEIYHI